MSVTKQCFGILPDGQEVELYKIENCRGASVEISTQGAAIVRLWMPDRAGCLADVVLGYDTPGEYLEKPKYIGEAVGRYGNRICGGKFVLNGKEYHLDQNNNGNCLHGGFHGFGKCLWTCVDQSEQSVTLALHSSDGEGGFPGNLDVTLTYTLDENDTLTLLYEASSDQDTVCSFAHHSYFNLGGHTSGDIANHEIRVWADSRLEVDDKAIPTGRILPLKGTPLDLRQPTALGKVHAMIGMDPFITRNNGIDCTFLPAGEGFRKMAEVHDPISGRTMEVFSDLPALQIYTAGFLNETVVGKGGQVYPAHTGFCMQSEFYPDSPNHPEFPSAVLKKGETYRHWTEFRFSAK